MAKSKNSKAKRKAPRPETFDVHLIPIEHRELTPKRALAWMRDRYRGFERIAQIGMLNADGDRFAYGLLAHSIEQMVEACTAAIGSGGAVRLTSEDCDHPGARDIGYAMPILRFPIHAQGETGCLEDEQVSAAYGAIATAVEAMVGSLGEAEDAKTQDAVRAIRAERIAEMEAAL